ncbi:MAG: cytochrome c family protein [Alphaproteobacteria bacterium]|nr:cytochrome c family protein [Alphaproteobacteria bacterium]
MRIVFPAAVAACLVVLAFGSFAARADEAGEKAFKKNCATCHTIEAGKNRVGPSLHGIIGRPAGQVAGFKYSDANAKSGVVFDEKFLDTYLTDPKAAMPGNKMVFNGVKNEQERKAVIEYLKAAK